MTNLLLEIGTEEIPAGYIQPALNALSSRLLRRLDETRIDHGKARTYGTPRRLVVEVLNVSEKQKRLAVEMTGPPERIGFDEKGRATVAAE